jgi:hypothetical protein
MTLMAEQESRISQAPVIILSLAKLDYFDGNPNEMTVSKLESLEDDIRTNGLMQELWVCPDWREPNDRYIVLDGNHRFMVLRSMGYTEVKCKILDWIKSEQEAISFIIRFNDFRGETSVHKMSWLINKFSNSGMTYGQIAGLLKLPIERVMRYSTYDFTTKFQDMIAKSNPDDVIPVPVMMNMEQFREMIKSMKLPVRESTDSAGNIVLAISRGKNKDYMQTGFGWQTASVMFGTELFEHHTRCLNKGKLEEVVKYAMQLATSSEMNFALEETDTLIGNCVAAAYNARRNTINANARKLIGDCKSSLKSYMNDKITAENNKVKFKKQCEERIEKIRENREFELKYLESITETFRRQFRRVANDHITKKMGKKIVQVPEWLNNAIELYNAIALYEGKHES